MQQQRGNIFNQKSRNEWNELSFTMDNPLKKTGALGLKIMQESRNLNNKKRNISHQILQKSAENKLLHVLL